MSTPTASLDKNAPYVLALVLGGLLLFVVAMSRTFGLSNLLRGPGQRGEGGAEPAKKLQIAGPYSLDEVPVCISIYLSIYPSFVCLTRPLFACPPSRARVR